MKKINKTKILLFNFLLFVTLFSYAEKRKQEYNKEIKKSFPINATHILKIENQFGLITVKNWDKNEFNIIVEIIVKAKNEDKGQNVLKKIDVEIKEYANFIHLVTKIENQLIQKISEDIKINYTVQMPSTNELQIINKFGDVVLDNRKGNSKIKVSYGALKASNFEGDCDLEISFGKAFIKSINKGEILAKYSNVNLTDGKNLIIDQRFSDVTINKVEKIDLITKYGAININNIDVIHASAKFTDVTIEELNQTLIIEGEYISNIKINKINASFNNIDIKSKFSSINLNLDKNISTEIEGFFKFGELNTKIDIDYSKKITDSHYSEMKGKIGKNTNNKKISINSSYGNCFIEWCK